MKTGIEVRQVPLLELDSLTHLCKAYTQDGYETRTRLLGQSFLPCFRVFIRSGPIVWCHVVLDLVVEVVLERAVRVARVPLLQHRLHLLGNALLA